MTAIIVNFKSVIYQLILPTSQLLYLNQPNFIVNFKGETYKTIHSFPNFPTRNRLCKAIVKDGNFDGILQSFHRLGLASRQGLFLQTSDQSSMKNVSWRERGSNGLGGERMVFLLIFGQTNMKNVSSRERDGANSPILPQFYLPSTTKFLQNFSTTIIVNFKGVIYQLILSYV